MPSRKKSTRKRNGGADESLDPSVATFDKMIRRQLAWKPGVGANEKLLFTVEELYFLIDSVRTELVRCPALLDIDPPVVVCGDIHGQYPDLLRLLSNCHMPPQRRYLMLDQVCYVITYAYLLLNFWDYQLHGVDEMGRGDYVDRGKWSIETVSLMFLFRLRYPNDFFILRGNHETAMINRVYSFYDECRAKYGQKEGIPLWSYFQHAFDCLPIAALISNKIFCMHGGLSPSLESFDQIRNLRMPFMIPNSSCLVTDLLWADPMAGIKGYKESNRGVSYVFGEDEVLAFCEKFEISLICRAHQVVLDGYEFFAQKKLVTIFSAPNYCGEFHNSAGMLYVSPNLKCKIKQLKPTK